MKKTTAARRALTMMCAAALASFALAGTAFAVTVHGADFHGTGSALESGEVDVLNVDGNAGDVVFLTVKVGDAIIAKNLPYTIGEGAAQGDGSTWNGVATLDIDGLDLNALDGTYSIEAYGSRAGTDLLYSGKLYGVYADLPDGASKLVGTRVVDASEIAGRVYEPAETVFDGGRTYRLVGEAASQDGALHFAYEAYDESTTIDGVIKYTDATGATVASTKIPGLAYGEERTVDIPSVVTADNGDAYRTVFFKNSVTAVNPGQTSFNVYCAKMTAADQAAAGFYLATIKMVDQNGSVIATDSVNVTGEFVYTCPTNIYKNEVVDAATGDVAVVTYTIDTQSVIRLSAANDGVQNHERTITVPYTAQPLDAAEATVTFNLIDGSKRINEPDRMLGKVQVVANEATPTVQPEPTVTVDGTTYYIAGNPSDYAYTLHSGAIPSIDVYYTPDGYKAPGAYDVTVNYVNFATNEVVESHSYTSDADANARILIATPAEFSANGVDYVRLAGQENDIQHSYYSGIASYTVYYRDVNDTLTSGTVINTIRVVYQDGTTTGGAADAGGAAAAGDAGGVAAALADGATALQLNAARTYNVFDGSDNNATLTNESGVDSNTERIEDSETPLASGFDTGASSSAASSLSSIAQWALPVGIGVVGVIIALIAFLAIRRRKNDDTYEL